MNFKIDGIIIHIGFQYINKNLQFFSLTSVFISVCDFLYRLYTEIALYDTKKSKSKYSSFGYISYGALKNSEILISLCLLKNLCNFSSVCNTDGLRLVKSFLIRNGFFLAFLDSIRWLLYISFNISIIF